VLLELKRGEKKAVGKGQSQVLIRMFAVGHTGVLEGASLRLVLALSAGSQQR